MFTLSYRGTKIKWGISVWCCLSHTYTQFQEPTLFSDCSGHRDLSPPQPRLFIMTKVHSAEALYLPEPLWQSPSQEAQRRRPPQHPSPVVPAPWAPTLSPDGQVPWLLRCLCFAQKGGLGVGTLPHPLHSSGWDCTGQGSGSPLTWPWEPCYDH